MRSDTLTLESLYPLSDETLAYGEAVARALLGLDALYRHESGDGTGLVVLNMDQDGRYQPDGFSTYGEAAERFGELLRSADFLPEVDRRVYYREFCHSTLSFIEWRKDGLGFRSQLGAFLRIPSETVSEQELDVLRGAMQTLLGEMGYSGDLKDRAARWEERTRVPEDEVVPRLNELLSLAWDRSNESLFAIPAPKSDGMKAEGIAGVPYNARCDYLARTIQLNTEPVYTDSALRHLAVHEGYGGHYVQFKMREHFVAEGLAPADNLLSVVNCASSCIFEGIADAAMEMMGWGEKGDNRLQYLMNRYRAGLGAGAAWRYHAQGWSKHEVTEWLRRQSLVGGEGWVQNRIRFIEAPERAVLIWSYWWGEPLVAEAWWKAQIDRRQEFLAFLYGRMHSNRSVGMFF